MGRVTNRDCRTCINLIITNRQQCFQTSENIEVGLSDFQKRTVIVLKAFYKKQRPKTIVYLDFRKFPTQSFPDELDTISEYSLKSFK